MKIRIEALKNVNSVLFWRQKMIFEKSHTLSGKKMSGESDENFEGVTKFSPNELNPRYFNTRPKNKSKFLHPELQKLVLWNIELQDLFSS